MWSTAPEGADAVSDAIIMLPMQPDEASFISCIQAERLQTPPQLTTSRRRLQTNQSQV